MVEIWDKFAKSSKRKVAIVYGIFFCVVFYFHLNLSVAWGDSYGISFSGVSDIMAYIQSRYNSQSSRIIIDLITIACCNNILVWKVLNSLIITAIPYLCTKILGNDKISFHLIMMMMTFVYPYSEMSSAGWIATTLNYLWPLFFMIVSCLPLITLIKGNQLTKLDYIIGLLSAVFASNMENTCVFLLWICGCYTIYRLLKSRQIDKYAFILLLIIICNLISIIICPGNAHRYQNQVSDWPAFAEFGLFQKIYLGTATTVITQFLSNRIFMLFSAMCFLCSISYYFQNHAANNSLFVLFAGFILFNMNLFFGFYRNGISEMFPEMNQVYQHIMTLSNAKVSLQYFFDGSIFTYSCIYVFLACYELYVVLRDKCLPLNWIVLVIFIGGLISRLLMGMTPSLFFSGQRTFLFLDFTLVLCAGALWNKMTNKFKVISSSALVFYIILMLPMLKQLSLKAYY